MLLSSRPSRVRGHLRALRALAAAGAFLAVLLASVALMAQLTRFVLGFHWGSTALAGTGFVWILWVGNRPRI